MTEGGGSTCPPYGNDKKVVEIEAGISKISLINNNTKNTMLNGQIQKSAL
jgi:hypothetical protein